MAPLIRGNSLYKLVGTTNYSWSVALENAVSLGGSLATINNKSENDFLFQYYRDLYDKRSLEITYYPTGTNNLGFLIGFSDANQEGTWAWTDGSITSFTNWATDKDHPDNDSPSSDYAEFMISIPLAREDEGQWNDTSGNHQGIAEIPLTSSITFSSTPKEGAGIFTTSINLSAGTASSGNLAEGATVYWKVSGITADDLATGTLTGSGTITNGTLDLQHSLKIDGDTGESFEISVFSDAGMTQQIGSTTSSPILEGAVVDTTKPEVRTLSVTPQWSDDVSGTRKVVIEGRFTDDISGLHTAHGSPVIEWWSPSGQRYGTHLHTLRSGNNLDGSYSGSFELSRFAESGTWKLMRLEFQDNSRNSVSHNRQTLASQGIATDFEIVNPLSDNSPPQIRSITLNPKWSPDASGLRILEIQARFTDDRSGLHLAHGSPVIEWWSPSGRNYGTHLHSLQSGNNTDGIYAGTIVLPEDADQGLWTLARLEFSDNARNSISHNRASLLALNINTDFSANQPLIQSRLILQSTTATDNQLILAFSEDIQIAGGGILNPAYMAITVGGRTRRITSSKVTGSQLALTLRGLSLRDASSISISYNPPSNGSNQGFVTDLAGNRLAAITSQAVDTYSTSINIFRSGIANAYKNLILTGTAPTIGYGNIQNNTITGNDANNILDGLAGADTMIGGLGDDTYIIDNFGDQITELTPDGTDTVQSSITYTLGENLENLTLLGSASINGTGNSANNTITGNSAANLLNGNGGADTLIGGRGNDTYIVESTDDTISEVASVTDTDTVQSSISWNLGYSLENLTLTGTSSINGTGNEGDNTISGNDAANIIDGGNGGTDRLTGLGGADTFRFSTRPTRFRNTSADHITDFSSAQGDKIQITKSALGITASTATLSVVSGDAALNTALSGSALFVYNTANGELHWNQNGITRGAGSGGVLAILDNKATLSAGDLMLV